MLYSAVSCRLLLNTQRVNWQSQINLAALCVRLSIKILFLRKIKNISSSSMKILHFGIQNVTRDKFRTKSIGLYWLLRELLT